MISFIVAYIPEYLVFIFQVCLSSIIFQVCAPYQLTGLSQIITEGSKQMKALITVQVIQYFNDTFIYKELKYLYFKRTQYKNNMPKRKKNSLSITVVF